MRRLVFTFLALLWFVSPVHAFVVDTWDEFGTLTLSQGQNGPYQANVNGANPFAIKALGGAPWNPSGTSHYLEIGPGTTSIPNAGPGVYFTPGNPFSGGVLGFWFRQVGSVTASGGGPFIARLNNIRGGGGGQVFGTDNIAMAIDASGTLAWGTQSVATSVGDGNWHFVVWCNQYGYNSSTGSTSLDVDGVNKVTATSTNIGSSGNWGAASFNFDNEFGSGTFDFGAWYFKDIGTSACPVTAPFTNIMYAKAYFPTANSTPLQFTPSTGTNFSNVNSAPVGTAFNSNATVGNQDIYTFTVPTTQTGIVEATLSIQVDQDANGDRITLPTWKSNGGTITAGTIQNQLNGQNSVLLNGSFHFMMDGEENSIFGGAWTAADLGHDGIQLNN